MEDPNSRAIYRAPDSDWLFEGLMPTTHVSAEYLRILLLNAGINPSQAKSAALRQLTTALPARFVADTIGISVDTASRWAQQSGGTWKDYPSIR
jgi:hypothetical protein